MKSHNEIPSNEQDLERFKLKLGLIKFLLGTVVIGLISLALNYQIQSNQIKLEEEKTRREIDLQEKKAEFEYLEKFMKHAVNKDINVRIQFADYMKSVALSAKIKHIWTKYLELLKQENELLIAQKNKLESNVNEKKIKLAEIPQNQQSQRIEIVQQISETSKEIALLKDKIDRKKYGTFEENYTDYNQMLRKAEQAKKAGHYEEQRRFLEQVVPEVPESLQYYVLTELALCFRSLHDFRQARLYMEQAAAMVPENSSTLYLLAIMQKNDNQMEKALKSLKKAQNLSTGMTKLKIQLVTAGYLILDGQPENGMKKFETIKDKLLSDSYFDMTLAWFYAVAGLEDKFYNKLEASLKNNRQQTLIWIDREVDLKSYREDARFKQLIQTYEYR